MRTICCCCHRLVTKSATEHNTTISNNNLITSNVITDQPRAQETPSDPDSICTKFLKKSPTTKNPNNTDSQFARCSNILKNIFCNFNITCKNRNVNENSSSDENKSNHDEEVGSRFSIQTKDDKNNRTLISDNKNRVSISEPRISIISDKIKFPPVHKQSPKDDKKNRNFKISSENPTTISTDNKKVSAEIKNKNVNENSSSDEHKSNHVEEVGSRPSIQAKDDKNNRTSISDNKNRVSISEPRILIISDKIKFPPVHKESQKDDKKNIPFKKYSENPTTISTDNKKVSAEITNANQNKNLINKQKEIRDHFQKLVVCNTVVGYQKRIAENPEILKRMFAVCDLEHILNNHDIKKVYELEDLDENSWEYQQIQRFFFQTNKRYFRIRNIEKIRNPYLLMQYILKKMELNQRCRYYAEEKMFHGTKKSNVDNICKKNFDWRLHGRALGSKFGQGVSFSPIAFYSTHYGDTTYNKVMIVADIICGKSCFGNRNMIIPDSGFDDSINNNRHVYVKYDDNTFYPAYVIHYCGNT